MAPDSFGGFRPATAIAGGICDALLARGWRAHPHPMSDGGEGLSDALIAHGATIHVERAAPGPMGERRVAAELRMADHAVLESSILLGLPLSVRAPRHASSRGLGQWLAAREPGPTLHIGLGGSATVDGGIGLAVGLGLVALDRHGRRLTGDPTDLATVARLDGPLPSPDAVPIADVRTPLSQAAHLYGLQKGLAVADHAEWQRRFARWADVLDAWRAGHGRASMERALPGGGASGGVGYALAALFDHAPVPGAPWFAQLTRLDDAVARCALVITGEGKLDATSFEGKAVEQVIAAARRVGRPVVAVAGQVCDVPAPPVGPDQAICVGPPDGGPDRDAAWRAAIAGLPAQLERWVGEP